jgi:hypothetical protein
MSRPSCHEAGRRNNRWSGDEYVYRGCAVRPWRGLDPPDAEPPDLAPPPLVDPPTALDPPLELEPAFDLAPPSE